MEKKYKLIKKYPSLPKDWEVGMEVGLGDRDTPTSFSPCNIKYTDYYVPYSEVVNFSEFWEKVVEKDYEIVSFKQNSKIKDLWLPIPNTKNKLWACYANNRFHTVPYEYEEILKSVNYSIHSVKRLSDGEIFTVGDKIRFIDESLAETYPCRIIKNFKIKGNTIITICDDNSVEILLKNLKQVKKPLFTTEDGVDIFEGDVYYMFNNILWNQPSKTICKERTKISTYYTAFSTKEAAEEYLLMNKPCLSFKEISPIFGQFHMDNSKDSLDRLTEKLKKIINEKI